MKHSYLLKRLLTNDFQYLCGGKPIKKIVENFVAIAANLVNLYRKKIHIYKSNVTTYSRVGKDGAPFLASFGSKQRKFKEL